MANLLTQIKNAVTSFFSGGFRSAKYNVWGVGTQEVYSPIEQETAISKGFNANTAVYSIVKKYAKKSGAIERYLENKETEETLDNHPLMKLLDRPNSRQSQDAFFSKVFAYYKICGEAFIWLNRGDVTQMVTSMGELVDRTPEQYLAQPILEMYVIASNHMVIIPDPENPFDVIGYQLRNRPDIKFRKEDIIHWMDINLEWDEFSRPQLRGMTPLKPGFKTLTADNSAIDSMVRMFQNDGAKGAIVNKTVGAKMSPQQQTQVRNVIDEKVNNKEVKNAIAALEGEWSYLDFGLTSVDMETLKGREFIYKEFCFLFGVPYELFDSQVTYANKAEAQKGWIINEIKPDALQLDGELNRMLLPAFGLSPEVVEICSNFDDLPELQIDKAKQVEWLMKAPVTMNEVREALEYEPIDDEKMNEVYIPTGITPIGDDPELDAAMDQISAMEQQAQMEKMNANGAGNRNNGQYKVPAGTP